MTSSAPSERTRSALPPLHTPVTCAPRALAICTAYVPVPPPAPMTITRRPAVISPAFTACNAVWSETGTAAACAKDTLAGLRARRLSSATASSAYEPRVVVP
jgi:hypothetical protein